MKSKLVSFLIFFMALNIGAKPKIDKNQYAKHLVECQAIATKIRSECSFEVYKQTIIKRHQQTRAALAERFIATGSNTQNSSAYQNFLKSSESQLQMDLNAHKIPHALLLQQAIELAIKNYLQGINSPTSLKLLSDLTQQGFPGL